jgi:hypothetical protein
MNVTVVAVHPSVVVLSGASGQFEIPRSAFPSEPKVGQEWLCTLTHEPTEEEKITDLNAILPRA